MIGNTTAILARRTRVALVGTGFIADFHAAALRARPDVELVAVCDRDLRLAETFRRKWQVTHVFGSAVEMLDACRPEVVHVTVPPQHHARVVAECLRGGCDLFVEKPMAATPHEAESLVRLGAAASRHIGVNHNMQFHPALQRAQQLVERGRLGRLEHVVAIWNVPLRQLSGGDHDHWMFREAGNILLEQAVHPLSQVDALLGPVRRVTAHRRNPVVLDSGRRFFTTWQVSLTCARGTAQCLLAFGKGFHEHTLHLIGEDGSAWVDMRRNTMTVSEKTRFSPPVDDLRDGLLNGARRAAGTARNFVHYAAALVGLEPPQDAFTLGMNRSVSAFYDARARGVPPPTNAEDGARLVRLCAAIARSAESGRPARLDASIRRMPGTAVCA